MNFQRSPLDNLDRFWDHARQTVPNQGDTDFELLPGHVYNAQLENWTISLLIVVKFKKKIVEN